ncbi:MAG TPA: VOC family protein, partial [Candidatus Eremiobacteraceae bacterium]|nr:VOC family protein [Candidatus Eremiobacteraceae bacterium]
PHPGVFDHMSFLVRSMRDLRAALAHLKKNEVDVEDPGDEIGPMSPGSKNIGLWFRDPDGYRWELSLLAKPSRRKRLAKKK